MEQILIKLIAAALGRVGAGCHLASSSQIKLLGGGGVSSPRTTLDMFTFNKANTSTGTENLAKALQHIAKSEGATLIIKRDCDGKMRVTSRHWEKTSLLTATRWLEVRNVDGQQHKPAEWEPPVRALRPVCSGPGRKRLRGRRSH